MELFYEKSFWGFLALVFSLVTVIYNLFKNGLSKDLLLTKVYVKAELVQHFEDHFEKKIDALRTEVKDLTKELESFKRHENSNATVQINLTKKLLKKMDLLDKIDPEILSKAFQNEE